MCLPGWKAKSSAVHSLAFPPLLLPPSPLPSLRIKHLGPSHFQIPTHPPYTSLLKEGRKGGVERKRSRKKGRTEGGKEGREGGKEKERRNKERKERKGKKEKWKREKERRKRKNSWGVPIIVIRNLFLLSC